MDTMEDPTLEKKIVLSGNWEDVIEVDEHYYLISKKRQVAVLVYTIDTKSLLDKVGVIKDYNFIEEDYDYTLPYDYISQDDGTNLVAANRVLYEIIGLNNTNADDWMYLGSLYNTLTTDSPIDLYCVDLTDKEIPETEEVEADMNKAKFKMIDASFIVTSDDTLLLASYLRLFSFFYTNSLSNNPIK